MNYLRKYVVPIFRGLESTFESLYHKSVKEPMNTLKLRLKIKKLLKNKPRESLSKTQKAEIKTFFRNLGERSISTQWHKFYSLSNGNFSVEYVPEDLFYVKIESQLNPSMFYPTLSDKNLLERLFPSINQPKTVVKNVNGFYYHNLRLIEMNEAINLCCVPKELIIKPTIETWGGNNVLLFNFADHENGRGRDYIEKLFIKYGKNFIVQERVQQHHAMTLLNSTSLNTFRVMTFLKGKEVFVLSTVVRMGREGSIIDNSASGGITCGIQRNGDMNEVGFDQNGKRIRTTDNGLAFKNMSFTFLKEIESTAKKLHSEFSYFRLLSWDLAIDKDENVVLIECNVKGQGINSHQLNNGPVLSRVLQDYRPIE